MKGLVSTRALRRQIEPGVGTAGRHRSESAPLLAPLFERTRQLCLREIDWWHREPAAKGDDCVPFRISRLFVR